MRSLLWKRGSSWFYSSASDLPKVTFLSSHWFSLALRSLCHCYVYTRVYEAELGEGTLFPTVLLPPRPLRPGPLLPLCNE